MDKNLDLEESEETEAEEEEEELELLEEELLVEPLLEEEELEAVLEVFDLTDELLEVVDPLTALELELDVVLSEKL